MAAIFVEFSKTHGMSTLNRSKIVQNKYIHEITIDHESTHLIPLTMLLLEQMFRLRFLRGVFMASDTV